MAAIAVGRLKMIEPDKELPADVEELQDLEYGKVGERSLKLDLALPRQSTQLRPGLIFIHGGGWSGGERAIYHYYTRRFAQRGYAAATISYRLSGEAPFPAAVQDAKCAVRWMRANAQRYRIDPDRIAVVGGSAGGHLAMMVGYCDAPGLEGDGGHAGVSSRVAAVLNFYGPTDLTLTSARDNEAVQKFMNGSYETQPDEYRLASPLMHLDAGDPPTLVIHGTLDKIVTIEHADRLVQRLEELKIPFVYDRMTGWPHALDAAEPVNAHCQIVMHKFLDRYLRAAGGPP